MLLSDIYLNDIHRKIDGVIKADDDKALGNEIQEYIITDEIASRLSEFLSAYSNGDGSNGAWISGFYGSGKSHLLKMLSFLLENKTIEGLNVGEEFASKIDDSFLKADIKKATAIPSRSVLFNIDQKAVILSKEKIDRLLAVFAKVFDDMCGYFGKQGHIAKFERDLDERGQLESFKTAYKRISGKDWEIGRQHELFEKSNIGKAFAETTGEDEDTAILAKYRTDYSLSIEDFALQVDAYIKKQEKGFRLNFFVDEVGQYIADDIKLMTNLQSIAETLNTRCGGKAWLVVTAQEDMDKIVGQMNANQSNDFSKIQARFQHRMKLTSQNVADVIQRRLLAKTNESEILLREMHDKFGKNFRTILSFSDGSRKYKTYDDEDHFVKSYPFVPYQFELFKTATEELSNYNHFEGRHASTGERTLLAVFQQVAKSMADQEMGSLATFDSMYEGIKQTLKSQVIRSITKAENQFKGTDDLAVRVLKALYLVKYVKEFKPTIRNICVLMHDRVDGDTAQIKSDIEKALTLLTTESYIRRNGDLYEYLTNDEKDVEEEIKQVDLDPDVQAKELLGIVFNHIVGSADRKIGLKAGDAQYNYTTKLDDNVHGGREYELSINIISPFHDKAGDLTTLRANNMGKDELLVILDPKKDRRIFEELTRYLKTEKYIKQNRGNFDESQHQKANILAAKREQMNSLKAELRERVRDLVGTAEFMAGGNDITVTGSDAKNRIIEGFQELIGRTYPNLKMLRGVVYSDRDLGSVIDNAPSLLSSDAEPLTEAENEIRGLINLRQDSTERPTVKALVDHYYKKPFGWSMAATLHQIASLSVRGLIDVTKDSNLLEGNALISAIKNTQSQQQINLRQRKEYDAASTRKLRKFHEDMFDLPARKTDARGLGGETSEEMERLKSDLDGLIAQQSQYPFAGGLRIAADEVARHAGKPHDYYLEHIGTFGEKLLTLKDETIKPISEAMKGDKAKLYIQARTFITSNGSDLDVIDPANCASLREMINSSDIYKGQNIRKMDAIRKDLEQQLKDAIAKTRAQSTQKLDNLKNALHAERAYSDLDASTKSQFDDRFVNIGDRLDQVDGVAAIDSMMERFSSFEYNGILEDLEKQASSQKGEAARNVEIVNLKTLYAKPGQVLRNEDDVKTYLDELERALLAAIKDGKQVRP